MGNAPPPAVPTSTHGPTRPGSDKPPPLTLSCIHPSSRHASTSFPRPAALSPHSASPRPMAGGPQGGSRECVGQLTKLNENKMANRCAMRQRPNPKREVPSQPSPCGIVRVLLVLARCARCGLRLQLAVPAFSASCISSSPRLSRSRGAGHLVLSLASFPTVLPFFCLSSCLSTLSSMYAHAVHLVPHWSLVSTGTCIAKQPTLIVTAFPLPSYPAKQLPERQTQIPRSPCHPRLQDSERSRAQDYFSMRLADCSPA